MKTKIKTALILLALGASPFIAHAQDDGGPPPPGGGPGGPGMEQGNMRNPGGPGGGPGGNFDPAQMQQRMMDNIRDQLGFTNDTDWTAVQPLVQKVMDARRDTGGMGMGRMFGGRSPGGPGPTLSAEAEALQKLIDDNAPAAQIKEALAKYREAQKAKQAKLVQAQEALRSLLTIKQEAQATLLGLVN
jgi:hypothetical protein